MREKAGDRISLPSINAWPPSTSSSLSTLPAGLAPVRDREIRALYESREREMAWYSGGLQGYWKRTAYRRLDGEDGPRRKVKRSKVELGGGRRRRFWRIRVSPKLRFLRVISPSRILSRIRDAYVRMMLAFASSGALSYGGDGRMDGFYAPPTKEYDERMILEIYKSVISQGQLIPTRRISSVSSCELVVQP